MKLWVARHAYAGDPSKDPKREIERPLTPEGVAMAKAIAQAMLDAGEVPNSIFASNYQRAFQTAIIYGKILGANVATVGDLAPIRPLTMALGSLVQTKGREKIKRVMIVGHVDNTTPTMNDLNNDGDWDDLVMGEVRRVAISRKDLTWALKWGVKPSDLGLKDYTA